MKMIRNVTRAVVLGSADEVYSSGSESECFWDVRFSTAATSATPLSNAAFRFLRERTSRSDISNGVVTASKGTQWYQSQRPSGPAVPSTTLPSVLGRGSGSGAHCYKLESSRESRNCRSNFGSSSEGDVKTEAKLRTARSHEIVQTRLPPA